MERITHKQINEMVNEINHNYKKEGYSVYADYASVYGGWRLNKVENSSGGHDSFNHLSSTGPRLSTKEFYQLLRGILIGIEGINEL